MKIKISHQQRIFFSFIFYCEIFVYGFNQAWPNTRRPNGTSPCMSLCVNMLNKHGFFDSLCTQDLFTVCHCYSPQLMWLWLIINHSKCGNVTQKKPTYWQVFLNIRLSSRGTEIYIYPLLNVSDLSWHTCTPA